MATKRNASLIALALGVLAMNAWSQDSNKPAVKSQLQRVEATVEAINPATRELTLKGPKHTETISVGPEVRNFENMKVGDKVSVSYYEGLAAQISKGDTKITDPAAAQFGYRAPAGAKPGGGFGQSVTTTVKIADIDLGTNTVALQRSDGGVRIVAVQSPEMRQFIRTLKRGDSVDVTYTESVAVDVVPAAGKSRPFFQFHTRI